MDTILYVLEGIAAIILGLIIGNQRVREWLVAVSGTFMGGANSRYAGFIRGFLKVAQIFFFIGGVLYIALGIVTYLTK